MPRAPILCIAHGGGPLPLLGDPNHKDFISSFQTRAPKILKLNTPSAPRAIVVVTAHWSEDVPTISSADHHDLYYDYGGFPREAYSLKYPAPGSPSVAEELRSALESEGLEPRLNATRGWDHGVFVPFKLINPAADVPIVALSVLASESPSEHRKMGAALAKLRDSNVAIVGSGFASFHNLSKFGVLFSGGRASEDLTRRIGQWSETLTAAVETRSSEDRAAKLEGWRDFPHSYEMHPRLGGEHFLPLLVCSGAAGEDVAKKYKDDFLGVDIWTYYWADEEI